MLLVDDIILIDEMRDKVNGRLKIWRKTLESNGFKLNRTKTKYSIHKSSPREEVSST